jgi:hypothetical protein
MSVDFHRIHSIEDEILRYLLRCPRAGDTIDGIRQWWLPQVRLDTAMNDIEQALDHLILEGKVIASTLPDGSVMYRNASP